MEFVVPVKKPLDNHLVFFRLDGARGVDENASGAGDPGRSRQQFELSSGIASQVFFPAIPADIGVSADHSRSGTGCIDQDPVEATGRAGTEMLECVVGELYVDGRRR